MTVVLVVQAVNANARAEALQRHGLVVNVTVIDCRGLASGTGITESGYLCRGSFVADGRGQVETIRGSSALLAAGQQVSAVVVPNDPASLSTPDAARTSRPHWRAFISAGICATLLAVALILTWWQRRRLRP